MDKQHNVKLVNMYYTYGICYDYYISYLFVFGTSKTNIHAKYTWSYRVGHSASTTGIEMSSREVS